MAATSLQFGPEWMRNKQQTARSPSMSFPGTSPPMLSSSAATPGASTYSSLLSSSAYETTKPSLPLQDGGQGQMGALNPFKYTKEEMLQVWRQGGGRGGLGLEVEQWEGVVKEMGGEPIGLRDMSESEKKLFSLPLNSELRRRQSHDFLPNSAERPKLGHSASSTLGSQRFGSLLARKRKEDGGDAGPSLSVPRRLSLTSLTSPLGTPLSPTGPGLPSPRPRIGSGNGSVYDGPADNWRKRDPDPTRLGEVLTEERDESGGAPADTSGSFSGSPDTSRSVSARSMAPSPPSVRDDSGLSSGGGGTDDLAMAVNVLSMLDEEKQPPGDSTANMAHAVNGTHVDATLASGGLYKNGLSTPQRPLGLDNDPVAISWSYMDPKGNEQGPFPAVTMQKWYEDGYFTPDLLMKRTHLDSGWTPMRELLLRANHEQLFFSTFSAPPPGLPPPPSHHAMNGFDRYNMSNFQGSEQFVNGTSFRHPTTASRIASLDSSYLGTTSSNSSQPSAFNPGILSVQTASPDLAFRNPAFVNGFDTQQTSSPLSHRPSSVGFGDSSSLLAALGHRNSAFEGQGFGGFSNSPAPSSPWGLNAGINEYDGLATSRSSLNNGMFGTPSIQGFTAQDEFNPDVYNTSNVAYSQALTASDSFSQFGQGIKTLAEGESGLQLPLETATFGNSYSSGDPTSAYAMPSEASQQQQIPPHSSITLSSHALQQPASSPWIIPPPEVQSRRPFDPPHPSARNIITSTTSTTDPVVSQTAVDSIEWAKSEVEAPQPVQAAPQVEAIQLQTSWNTPPPTSPVEDESAALSTPSDTPQPAITKKRGPAPIVVPETAPVAAKPPSIAPSIPPAVSKPAWATPTEDEKIPKAGLREIQQAEAKKAEVRKLAEQKEREKERPTRAGSHEEAQTFTASWGLPTSQAGAARTAPKEPLPGPASTPAPIPVWTNAAKQTPVVKKSMIEIQEEEQRRKKAIAKERELAAVAARRGYADSANKSVPAQPSGGAWMTVGASGKPTTTRQVSANSQPPTSAVRPSGVPAARPSGAGPGPTAQVTKPSTPVIKQPPPADDLNPPPPSPEFMKWLRDNMREFSSGFNTEDFMQMILSFSLDFPQPIIELIQEQVYANSTTMNGQRFAAEFVAKRKADAANRPKISGKQPSLAEVVKTQPKPAQTDLQFKVVKKKGRGQR